MTEAPDRSARAKCWEARDAFFACLDANNEQAGACGKQQAAFNKDCAASWVDYFVKRRQLQKRQDATYARDAGNLATAAASPATGKAS